MFRSRKVADVDHHILLEQQLRAIREAEEKADTDEQNIWCNVAEFAAKDGRFYAPATEDLWFKFATGSDGGEISSAFIKTVVALSFRHFDTQPLTERTGKKMDTLVGLLPSRPNPKRRVATDFAAITKFRIRNEEASPKLKFVSSTKDRIRKNQPDLQSMSNILEALLPEIETISAIETQSAILRDSINRGTIISSEMQVVDKKNPEGHSDMINRADDYVAFLKQRDHGKGSADGRVLKLESDGEVSRSVAEVVWEVSDDQQIAQSVKCLARPIVSSLVETARGDIITFVPLIKVPSKILDGDRNSEEFQSQVMKFMNDMDGRVDNYFAEKISAITEETKHLVKQVVKVINFSHLMWPELVGSFLPEVRKMCEKLKITGNSIMNIQGKDYQSEYVESLLGRFRNAEREIKNAKQEAKQEIKNAKQDAEQEIKNAKQEAKRKIENVVRFFKELGSNQNLKVRRDLLAKHNLTEKDLEVSSDTTPGNSPSAR
jgi:vacuolar-type H+-ATPase subunit H